MPIFEYLCESCGNQFEQLCLKSDDEVNQCPKCGAEKVKKLMSAASFRPQGIPTGSGGFKPPACATSDE
jgi:putative FmdB family regulatory protein